MSEVLVQDSSLQDIADAIREKNGTENTYKPSEMGNAVRQISGGGGSGVPPEALVLTGDCSYRFANNGWNWFLEEYGDRINFNCNKCEEGYCFANSSGITNIPFELNFSGTNKLVFFNFFYNCTGLKKAPKINCENKPSSIQSLFDNCMNLELIDNSWGELDFTYINQQNFINLTSIFYYCKKLMEIPQGLITNLKSIARSNIFSNRFAYCYNLNKIHKLGIADSYTSMSSNNFNNTFYSNKTLKELTFDTQENGDAYIFSNWNKQTIDLSNNIGYGENNGTINDEYNEHKVIDDVTYNQYKNEEYWFTTKVEYSRYNHDSAVNTINSLPDVSAGTGNTIKFKGDAGSKTDGGAINTLTEEEIAVASAKGWTVTLV